MHLLTTRSGELVSLVKPLCDDRGCTGCAGLVGLDSAELVDFATVVARPDSGTTALVSAAVGFLERTGWVDKDPELIAEYALDMAALTTEVARGYPPGTMVRAPFNRDTDEWIITCANQCASNPPTGAPKASPLPATGAPSGRWATIAPVVAAVVSILAIVGHLPSHKHAAQPSHQVSYSSQTVLPFTGLDDPSRLEVDGAGDVYVVDHGDNRVVKLAQASGAQTVLPFTGVHPSGVEVDGAGNLYVASWITNRVVKLAQASGAQTVLPFTGLNHPSGVEVDGAGDVYVVDTGNKRVVKLAQASGAQTVLPITGLNHPSGMEVDGAGDVYVVDTGNNRVVKLAQASGAQTVLPFTGLNHPYDVAVDTAGTVYVADFNNNRVVKLPAQ
jgi:streptogramin lyase